MLAIFALLIGLFAFVGVMRRGGLAAWVGLFCAMVAYGGDPEDGLGAIAAAGVGFAATRLLFSYARGRSWNRSRPHEDGIIVS